MVTLLSAAASRGSLPPAAAQVPATNGSVIEASARVDAFVTRTVANSRLTLPAALVPALAPGDTIDVTFPDYTRPPARANYHVNVAFITQVAPQHWLLERSSAADRLFRTPPKHHGRGTPPRPPLGLRFTYGTNDERGIPIFVIVPEDSKTRGMDGVRDYLNAHPTDFKNMAESANDAADRYVWFQDFLTAIAQGSIDPISARQRVESVAGALGANPATIDACYAAGGGNATVAACIQTSLQSVAYQPNIEAPTQAQFFGGAFGAVAPVQIASYLVPLLSVWKLFVHTGHQEYEYLPTTLTLAPGAAAHAPSAQLLTGLKVPTLRPPAAYSDVLFFTVGDPQAMADPPAVVDAAAATGTCAAGARLALPLHLDRTSAYVHDTHLVIVPDGKPAYSVPIDPHSAGTPVIDASVLTGAADGAYTLALAGRYGFDGLREPDGARARVVLPHAGPWELAPLAHHDPIAGQTFDAVAASPTAPCVTRAELQVGDAPPLALDVKHLSERRIALHGSLQNIPPGEGRVRLYEADAVHDTEVESDARMRIGLPPAHVAASQTAYLDDPFVALSGAALDTVSGLRLGTVTYEKAAGSTADAACFVGPPVSGPGYVAGQALNAELIQADGSPGQAFVVKLAAQRPMLLPPPSVVPQAGLPKPDHIANIPLTVEATTVDSDIPRRFEFRVRRALETRTPCDAVRDDDAPYAVVPAADVALRNPDAADVTIDAAALLHEGAFGELELQLADTAAKVASRWVPLPVRFLPPPPPPPQPAPAAPTPAPSASPL